MEKKPLNRMEPQPLNGMEPAGPDRAKSNAELLELKRAMIEGNQLIREYTEEASGIQLEPDPAEEALNAARVVLEYDFNFTKYDIKRFNQLVTREIKRKK